MKKLVFSTSLLFPLRYRMRRVMISIGLLVAVLAAVFWKVWTPPQQAPPGGSQDPSPLEIHARVIRLKPNSTQKIEEWVSFIEGRRIEALNSLKEEGVEVESWFRVDIEGKEYLIGYMRVQSLADSRKVARNTPNPIGINHRKFKDETWDRQHMFDTELLIDLAVED